MKYNEIIGLHDYFQPNYDLTNEVGTYWKQFIPNKKFFDALSKTLNSIESGNPDESKSLWLRGDLWDREKSCNCCYKTPSLRCLG